jgi:hypothetical protein
LAKIIFLVVKIKSQINGRHHSATTLTPKKGHPTIQT